MKELWQRIAKTSAAKIYALVAGLALVMYTSRTLGPIGRGELAVASAWSAGFATITHMSLGQVALRRAAAQPKSDWLRELVGPLLYWCVIASILSWLAASYFIFILNGGPLRSLSPTVLALSLLSVPLLILEQYTQPLLLALDRLDVANKLLIISRTSTLFAVVALFQLSGPSVAGTLVAALLGQTLVAGGGVSFFASFFSPNSPRRNLLGLLGEGLRLHPNAIGTFLFASCDLLLVDRYLGHNETGQYQLALQLITVMMVLPQAASTVLYARVARFGADAAWPMQRRLICQLLPWVAFIALLSVLFAPLAVSIIAGDKFNGTVGLLRWLIPAFIGNSFAALMAPQWIGRGLFKEASSLTLALGTVNVALDFLLIPKCGARGAAWASDISAALGITANAIFAAWCTHATKRDSKH